MPDQFEVWIISTTTMTYGEWLEERARQEEEHTRRMEAEKRRREMMDRLYDFARNLSEAERAAFAQRVQMEAMQRRQVESLRRNVGSFQGVLGGALGGLGRII